MPDRPKVGCGSGEDKVCVHNRFGKYPLKDYSAVIEEKVEVGIGYRKEKPETQG